MGYRRGQQVEGSEAGDYRPKKEGLGDLTSMRQTLEKLRLRVFQRMLRGHKRKKSRTISYEKPGWEAEGEY